MSSFHVSSPKLTEEGEFQIVSCDFIVNQETTKIWFKTNKNISFNLKIAQDAFFICALIPAMKMGADLTIESPISSQLKESSKKIQAIFTRWFSDFNRINVSSPSQNIFQSEKQSSIISDGNAQFFSGGVDSFYTLLTNQNIIQDLYFVIYSSDLKKVSSRLRKAATQLDKKLIEIETNIRDFSTKYVLWPNHYHGAVMAAMAMLMSHRNSTVYFANSYPYEYLRPWGSHIILDPLWSTEYCQIIHDGAEASRLEKIFYITKFPITLETLNWGCGGVECKRKGKCIRTLISLDLVGVLNKIKHSHPLEINDIERMNLSGSSMFFAKDNYKELLKRNDKKEIRRALRIAIQNAQNKSLLKQVEKHRNSLKQSSYLDKLRELI